jgi:methionine aminotransferase
MAFFPSSRLPNVGTTIFTVMSRLAAEHGAINLSQGFPDFSPRRCCWSASATTWRPAPTSTRRWRAWRRCAKPSPRRWPGFTWPTTTRKAKITVTAGATQAIYTAIASCVRPGDEVIVFAPVYDSYVPGIELNGGHAVYAHLRFPDFKPDWDEVRRLITPRTRMIIINSPHNPSGAVWSADDMAMLETLVRDSKIVVVSDEVYEHVVFDQAAGRRHESVTRYPGLRERSFVVSSFGKTYHVTGWKVAYCLAPRALTTEFRKAHQFIVFTVHHPSQLALADFMRAKPDFADNLAAFYQAKRDFFRQQLEGLALRAAALLGHLFPARHLRRDQRRAGYQFRSAPDQGIRRRGDSRVGVQSRWRGRSGDPLLLCQERKHAGGGRRAVAEDLVRPGAVWRQRRLLPFPQAGYRLRRPASVSPMQPCKGIPSLPPAVTYPTRGYRLRLWRRHKKSPMLVASGLKPAPLRGRRRRRYSVA